MALSRQQSLGEGSFLTCVVPDELLLEILVRLPVKSLIRFRCVSRPWYTFIASPEFISAHTYHNSNTNNYHVLVRTFNPKALDKKVRYKLCQDNDTMDQITTIDFPFVSQHNDFLRMVGCVNGLVCLSDDIVEETDTLVLWNPVIRRFLTLPPPEMGIDLPNRGQSVYGFGYEASTKDYKVVRILYHNENSSLTTKLVASTAVFRLSTNSWAIKKLTSLPLLDSRQAYVNGVIHWLAYKNFVKGFDTGSEEFKKISLPKPLKKADVRNLTIAPWCGLLSIFVSGYYTGWGVSLWVMNDYGNKKSWVKQFAIEPLAIVRSLRRNGNVILENAKGELFSYNHNSNQIEDSKIPIEGSVRGFHMKSYLESLVLLDRVDAQPVCSSPRALEGESSLKQGLRNGNRH